MASEKAVIELCGRVGKILLENGAETGRVEGTVEYIGKAAGMPVSCHAEMTAIFVDADTDTATHLIKVRTKDFNLRKVDQVNTLSRQFVAKEIDFAALSAGITAIDHNSPDYTWPQKIFGAGLVSVAPMLLFQATWADLGLAFFVGIFGYLAAQWAGRRSTVPYLPVGVGGVVIGCLAAALQHFGIATSADNIIISALMPLVPGVALTNSLRELIGRHTISGVVRAMDAVMVAASIGAGVVVGTTLTKLVLGGL